jgi:hypothetical protein
LQICYSGDTKRIFIKFLVSVLVERVMRASVYILHLLEFVKYDFVFNVIRNYGEWKIELVNYWI